MNSIQTAFDLSGRVAIITGGARGIGRAGAMLLGEAGAHVVLADVLDEQAAQSVVELKDLGLSCESVHLDVSNREAVNAAVQDVVNRHGKLDVMINNAAVIADSSPMEVTEEELDRVHAVNFRGVVFGSQAAGRAMMPNRSGSIINVVSAAVDIPAPAVIAYSTAKAASSLFSRSLALELGPHNVRVNLISPGWIDTPLNERHVRGADGAVDVDRKAEYVSMRAESSPLGIPGAPEDPAFAMLYLASDAARFVTGANIRPNGGMVMPW